MKRLLFLGLVLFIGQGLFAQGFQVGASGGIPVGNSSDFSNFAVNVDAAYLFDAGEGFSAGAVIGYSHSFVDFTQRIGGVSFDLDDVQFLPIAGRGSWNFAEDWSFQGDIGFAIGLNDGNDGGFYYSPKFVYWLSNIVGLSASFRGVAVSNGGWNMVTLGVEFDLSGRSYDTVE